LEKGRRRDSVEKGEPIFDIETEKATITARSPYKGILKKILVQTEVQLR
jgi:pyruvate/2-oxoglutarate dehydrogenase complex dihydrolipoamide acyltransferase (E2) component